jgi:hypothetical protein
MTPLPTDSENHRSPSRLAKSAPPLVKDRRHAPSLSPAVRAIPAIPAPSDLVSRQILVAGSAEGGTAEGGGKHHRTVQMRCRRGEVDEV